VTAFGRPGGGRVVTGRWGGGEGQQV